MSDSNLAWIQTDGWAGRILTPCVIIQNRRQSTRVRLLAHFLQPRSRGFRRLPGEVLSVPTASLTTSTDACGTRIPVYVDPGERDALKVDLVPDPKALGEIARACATAKGGDPSEWPEDLRVREIPR